MTTDVQGSRELRMWSLLAIAALAISGMAAPILALSRVPGIESLISWPGQAFEKGLVTHVVFSFVVWFLAVMGAMGELGAAGGSKLGRIAFGLSVIACGFLLVPAFLDRGQPTLNNYVPVIIDPLYYQGLMLLGAGVLFMSLRILRGAARALARGFHAALAAAAVSLLVALICFVVAGRLLAGETASAAFNEDLFWGGGHALQFVNAALLIAAWALLTEKLSPVAGETDRMMRLAALLLLFGVLVLPVIYFITAPFGPAQTAAFTWMQYALAPPVMVAALAVAPVLAGAGPVPWRDPAKLALALSPLVFGVGGLLGLFVDGTDTRTPAHYHGVIAGINVAFMGVFLGVILPALGRAVSARLAAWQIGLFAGGQTFAALGLFLAGGYGVPRKTAGDAQGLADLGAQAGLYMNGIGALVAVIGGVLFVVTVARALLKGHIDSGAGAEHAAGPAA